MRRDLPLHRSLLIKLLGLSALVLTCSIVTVSLLSVHLTTAGLKQQQGQALGDDIRVYTALVNYAATHDSWAGVGPTVAGLAARSGQQIVVTTPKRQRLAASGPGGGSPRSLPSVALATVDPLNVNTALIASTSAGQAPLPAISPAAPTGAAPVPARPSAAEQAGCPSGTRCLPPAQPSAGSPADRIDPAAVGPYLLPRAERAVLHRAALNAVGCLRANYDVTAQVAVSPTGRAEVVSPYPGNVCYNSTLDQPTATESTALAQLTTLVNACLASQHAPPVKVLLGFVAEPVTSARLASSEIVSSCLATGRAEQLARYVAPPALVFVGSSQPASATLLSLSAANRTRIAEVAVLVLLATMAITTAVSIRITRPLHALARAARQASRGDFSARVTVKNHDETSIVAGAFNEMAEQRQQAEAQRKAMVNDIAHELRTPVSNIRGWLEAAQDGLSEPAEALASLHEEALVLARLISDLQDLAAADAGELAIHVERVDLGRLLGNVAQAHRGTADAKRIRLTSRGHGQLTVAADPVRLRQAIANLTTNAIRHTPAGGAVTLVAWPDGNEAVIEVADTGPGIDARHLPFLFERFWRADRSRSRQTGGSGLGLAITRKLAEAHHGTVSAANGGNGAVFTLRIPLNQPGRAGLAVAGDREPGPAGQWPAR
jgi:two-component system sensor histidine kinase BaeS